jgi:hypothetical protein
MHKLDGKNLLVKLEDMDGRDRAQRGYKNCVNQFKGELWVYSREVWNFNGREVSRGDNNRVK